MDIFSFTLKHICCNCTRLKINWFNGHILFDLETYLLEEWRSSCNACTLKWKYKLIYWIILYLKYSIIHVADLSNTFAICLQVAVPRAYGYEFSSSYVGAGMNTQNVYMYAIGFLQQQKKTWLKSIKLKSAVTS